MNLYQEGLIAGVLDLQQLQELVVPYKRTLRFDLLADSVDLLLDELHSLGVVVHRINHYTGNRHRHFSR